MTFGCLETIMEKNSISKDVKLMSDSGWECDATDMDGLFYNRSKNVLVFTQGVWADSEYAESAGWICLHRK